MVNWSKFSGISPEQARKELAEIAKRMNQQIPQPVKKSNNSRTYKKHFEKIIFAEQYLNGIKKNHPNSEIINIPPGERGEYTFMIKDNDATEGEVIKQYGKEKETETMPLEKNPVQAQDRDRPLFFYEQNVGRKKLKDILDDLKRRKQTLERAISGQEHYYTNPKTKQDEQELAGVEMQIKTVQNLLSKATHDEAPTDVKDAHQNGEHVKVKNHGTGEVIELKVLRDNGDGTLEVKAPNGAVITIKESWIVNDEEPNHVQDSYEMLKLCGIIS